MELKTVYAGNFIKILYAPYRKMIFFFPKAAALCRMKKIAWGEQYVKFITEYAMMRPGIIIETNKKGFAGIIF